MFPFSSWANIVSLNNSPATVSVACRQKRHANFRQREREREREREKDREGEREKKKEEKKRNSAWSDFLPYRADELGPFLINRRGPHSDPLRDNNNHNQTITIRLSQSHYHNHRAARGAPCQDNGNQLVQDRYNSQSNTVRSMGLNASGSLGSAL